MPSGARRLRRPVAQRRDTSHDRRPGYSAPSACRSEGSMRRAAVLLASFTLPVFMSIASTLFAISSGQSWGLRSSPCSSKSRRMSARASIATRASKGAKRPYLPTDERTEIAGGAGADADGQGILEVLSRPIRAGHRADQVSPTSGFGSANDGFWRTVAVIRIQVLVVKGPAIGIVRIQQQEPDQVTVNLAILNADVGLSTSSCECRENLV